MTSSAPITLSLLDMFRIGPGPSSSHTVGPMRAARAFRELLIERSVVPARLRVELRGSLSATGRGHGTDRAVIAGLMGWEPETVDPDAHLALLDTVQEGLDVAFGDATVRLDPDVVVFGPTTGLSPVDLPHPNTLQLQALDDSGAVILEETWCSVGGGFIQRPEDIGVPAGRPVVVPPHDFHDADSLIELAWREKCSIGDIILENEFARFGGEDAVRARLDAVVKAFRACIDRGLARRGELPGGLGVKRRAAAMAERLDARAMGTDHATIGRAQAFAYAVSEENAAGGQVVTAPTNGAAGIFPAVLIEAADRLALDRDTVHAAIATGGAIAMIIRVHASLSGAEVGCQGEVGSATAMAAAALCQIAGGSPNQVENAAEIGLEHNLGLTCDPIGGLVQAPCIERNAMGVAKAWSASQLALCAEDRGIVSLDQVVAVMRRTGRDMGREYKETSEGGLAVAIIEC